MVNEPKSGVSGLSSGFCPDIVSCSHLFWATHDLNNRVILSEIIAR